MTPCSNVLENCINEIFLHFSTEDVHSLRDTPRNQNNKRYYSTSTLGSNADVLGALSRNCGGGARDKSEECLHLLRLKLFKLPLSINLNTQTLKNCPLCRVRGIS